MQLQEACGSHKAKLKKRSVGDFRMSKIGPTQFFFYQISQNWEVLNVHVHNIT